jgi:hypothetical protein
LQVQTLKPDLRNFIYAKSLCDISPTAGSPATAARSATKSAKASATIAASASTKASASPITTATPAPAPTQKERQYPQTTVYAAGAASPRTAGDRGTEKLRREEDKNK